MTYTQAQIDKANAVDPNKHFATQKWRLYIRTLCLQSYF